MAKKFLDLEGLKTLWTKITGKITASENKLNGEIAKKANAADVYTKNEVNTELGKKQNTLVSGTNIRTINGQSLLDVAKGDDLKVVTDLSNYYNKGQTDTAINNAKKAVKDDLLGGAGEAFDTLKELSTALGDDPNFATTITNKIGGVEAKANQAKEELKTKLDASSGANSDKWYNISDNTGMTSGSTDKLEILKQSENQGTYSGVSFNNGQVVLMAGHEVGNMTDCTGLIIDQFTASIKKFEDLTDPDTSYYELLDESMAITTQEIEALV